MSEDQRKRRPIDGAFWKAWEACNPGLRVYAYRFTKNNTGAIDLVERALDAIIAEDDDPHVRPWRDGTELVDHAKGCIRSMHSNESTSMSELVLRKSKKQRDPNPAAETRSPLEEAIDNEETRIWQATARVLREKARPGSLEQRFLEECARGVEDVQTIADNLGITYRQAIDVQKGVRRKADELLRERGYDALVDGEES